MFVFATTWQGTTGTIPSPPRQPLPKPNNQPVWCDINQTKQEKKGDNDGNNNNTGDVHQSHIYGELVLFSMHDSYVVLLALPWCCYEWENNVYKGIYEWWISKIMKLLQSEIFEFFICWQILAAFQRWKVENRNDSNQPLILHHSTGIRKQYWFSYCNTGIIRILFTMTFNRPLYQQMFEAKKIMCKMKSVLQLRTLLHTYYLVVPGACKYMLQQTSKPKMDAHYVCTATTGRRPPRFW